MTENQGDHTNTDQSQLTPEAQLFIRDVVEASRPVVLSDEVPRIQANKISSSIATLYEQLRNTIDSTEQHLLRRNAIARFLKRHIFVFGTQKNLGDLLIRELILSGYIANNTFPEKDLPEIEDTIQKYLAFNQEITHRLPGENPRKLEEWGMELAAAEIENKLYCPDKEESLVRFAFEEIKQRIRWEDDVIPEQDREIQLYIAVHRAVFKSDALTIEYHLLSAYHPEWNDLTANDAVQMAEFAISYRDAIREHIYHPQGIRLAQKVRRMTIPYQACMDAVQLYPEVAEERMAHPDTFVQDTVSVVEGYYKQNKSATRRSTFRSIFFIFITKMMVALSLEIPYDLWVSGEIRYLPLAINVFFHPIYLLALGTFVRFPGKDNTKRILTDLRQTIIQGKKPPTFYVQLRHKRSAVANVVLFMVYLVTFVVTFGAMIYGLWYFDFGVLGGLLFIFFLSVVTFFGIRLRQRARTFYMIKRKESLAGVTFWFFASPVIEVGRWFSTKFAKYNLFLFFFDIFLEAPLRGITVAIEEWFKFARERTEEIGE